MLLPMHFRRTENGVVTDDNGDLVPANQSSCMVQAQWEWANSSNSGKWSRPWQAYRYKRAYIPANGADPYDTGFYTIVSKTKIRGFGKVLSLYISTEPEKDCKLLGWSTFFGIETDV
jgi:hypothetical protein